MNERHVTEDLQSELVDMKARVKDLMRAVDELGDGRKKIMSSQFKDLHALIEQLIGSAARAGNNPAAPGKRNEGIDDWWERRASGWSPD